jgi:hypothetical protein
VIDSEALGTRECQRSGLILKWDVEEEFVELLVGMKEAKVSHQCDGQRVDGCIELIVFDELIVDVSLLNMASVNSLNMVLAAMAIVRRCINAITNMDIVRRRDWMTTSKSISAELRADQHWAMQQ